MTRDKPAYGFCVACGEETRLDKYGICFSCASEDSAPYLCREYDDSEEDTA